MLIEGSSSIKAGILPGNTIRLSISMINRDGGCSTACYILGVPQACRHGATGGRLVNLRIGITLAVGDGRDSVGPANRHGNHNKVPRCGIAH